VARGGPTLGELHERYPDFSEKELLEQLAELDPTPAEKKNERRRMTARRVRAITSLRLALDLLERNARFVPPSETDPVEAWLSQDVALPLRSAGVHRLRDLATLVDERGYRWFAQVPGIGPRKALQTVQWLRTQVQGFEERVGDRALVPPRELRPALLERRPKETGIVPFEYFEPTPATSGYLAANRVPVAQGGLPAVDDRDAINRWLLRRLKTGQLADPHARERNPSFRAYRREVERLWAWAVVQRNKALSALNDDDIEAYRTFLLDPQPRDRWVGPKKPRWHPQWRPFTALPSPRSREHILGVVGALFDWWLQQGYIVRNPWKTGTQDEKPERPQFSRRSLSLAAWNGVRDWVTALPEGEKKLRLRALLGLLYSSGLRRAELAAATTGSLSREYTDDGQAAWELKILGKGSESRQVPVSGAAMEALRDYFGVRFGARDIPAAAVPLFVTLRHRGKAEQPLGSWGVNAAVQEAFEGAARVALDQADGARSTDQRDYFRHIAGELRAASAHWLRHTFATHALKHDEAELAVIQQILGHADIKTTAKNYIDSDRAMRRKVAEAAAERARL